MRFKSIFVSKHNQSLNVSSRDIIEQCENHGLTRGSSDYRLTASHVILKDCPFCTKPANGKADNQFKCYIHSTTGAYFCHRCGSGGSWFDWKLKISGNLGSTVDPSYYGSQEQSPLPRGRGRPSNSENAYHHPTSTGAPRDPPRSTAPLPMPSPRLQALYSTQLLDIVGGGGTDHSNNPCLEYLIEERGLNQSTLRKYGVGRAEYSFADNAGTWKKSECVTFPWIMNVTAIEYQENLRGAKFTWEGAEAAQQKIQALAAAAASTKKDAKKIKHAVKETSESSNTTATEVKTVEMFSNGEAVIDKPLTLNEMKEQTFLTRRIKVRSIEQKSWQRMDPPGGGWGLFGFHTVPPGCREIVLTEGEYDALAVWQATGRAAVSLPNGCRSLPVEVLPLLEDFSKIYLWTDNDAAGQEGAEQFAKKLGLQRTYIVRPTVSNCKVESVEELPKDANDALRQGLDLEHIVADAKLVPHERIVHFSDLRAEVLHEIMHPDKYVGVPITSLPGLTNIIKGLRRGELTVITGPTGSGKTTFLGQVSLDLVEQDVNVLWGSFEIKNTRLMHKLLQQFAREPLPAGDSSMASKLEALADRFERLPFSFMKFHGGSDVDDVLDAMDYAVYVNDVEHIILDNMQFMVSLKALGKGSTFDKFDVQDVAVEKFRKFATDRNVHVTLVVHPRKEAENTNLSMSSIYGSAKATQEADTVLILQNDGRRKFLEVKKNRFNGGLGHTPLHFDRRSCRYAETPVFDVSNSDSKGSDKASHTSNGSSFPSHATPHMRVKMVSPMDTVNPWDKMFSG